MLDFLQIPVSQINNIKAGADWTTESGQVIPNSRLVIPADPARSYAYCSDTRYIPTLHQLLCGIDTIYHESTYTSDYEDRARLYYHSTSKQAASVARDAGAKQLLLGHYSACYIDESKILAEAKTIFPNSKLTDEGKIFDV
jgi:ribonuclease Z